MLSLRGAAVLVLTSLIMAEPSPASDAPSPPKPLDARAAAMSPAPGTVVPTAFAFTPDSKGLTYLYPEKPGEGRLLWRIDEPGKPPKVVGRPPGQGDTDRNVSQAEALRRERMRLRETGITQIHRASKADVAVVPLQGDLYLVRGDQPLERLTTTPAPEIDPQLSPDGARVAFAREGELYRLEIAKKEELALTKGATAGITRGVAEFMAQEEMNRFSGFWWSPDGAKIAYQETDERPIPQFTITHDGSDAWSAETHHYPFSGAANARVKLGVISADGGETTWLKLGEADEDLYLARVNWDSPGTLLVQVLTRDQKSLRLYRFEVDTGARLLLLEERADDWVNLHDALRPLGNTGEFLWASERTGYRHLEVRSKDGGIARILTSGEWAVDEVLGVDRERREVWFSAGRDDCTQLQAYRVSLDGGLIIPVTSEPGTHKVSVSPDGNHYVDVFSTPSSPPRISLRNRDGGLVQEIADAKSDPRLSAWRLSPPELTEFKNRDGVTLHGAYYAARSGILGEKAPLVVMVYGGPHVQRVTRSWDVTADLTAQFLAERGFAVWKVDNRGSSRRGHAFEAALHRDMGSVEVRDQVDGVKFVEASWPEVDTRRVGVTGGSYGGYMTLRSLIVAPDVFKAGVALAPVTDWDGYDTCYTERYMGTPANNPPGYKRSSVLHNADRLDGALLVVHGMLDENVHFRHSARLANALIAAGKPFELLPLPDSRHSTRKEADRAYINEKLADFFVRSLGPSK